MTRWMLPFTALFTLTLALALSACVTSTSGDDDDDDDGACETIQSVCAKVFECGGWGWADEAECEEGFLDNPAYYTDCIDTYGYLCCVADCMDLDCDPDFSDCEHDCWDENCMSQET